VTGISLVVDSAAVFADKEQTVLARNVRINASTFYTGQTTPPTNGAGLTRRWPQPESGAVSPSRG